MKSRGLNRTNNRDDLKKPKDEGKRLSSPSTILSEYKNANIMSSPMEPKSLKEELSSYYSWSSLLNKDMDRSSENGLEFNDTESNSDRNKLSYQSFSHEKIFSDLLQPDYLKTRPVSEEELAQSRKTALQRLIEKRKEMQVQTERQNELMKMEDNIPRVRWRGDVKKKRLQELDDHLDQSILHDVIHNDPMLLIQILNNIRGTQYSSIKNENDRQSFESLWNELTSGLEVGHMNRIRSPFRRFADNMKRQLLLSQSEMLHKQKMPRLRGDTILSQPTAKSFLKKISDSMSGSMQRKEDIAASSMNHSNHHSSHQFHDHHEDYHGTSYEYPTQADHSNPEEHEENLYSHYEPEKGTETQISPLHYDQENDIANTTFDFSYRKSNRRRNSGLLSKFVDKVSVNESGDEIAHVSAEGGYVLTPGFYDPCTEAGAKLISDASFARYFERFVDTVFVSGPSPEDINDFAISSSNQFFDGSNDGSQRLSLKFQPNMLFSTKISEDLDAPNLPNFCFPCWIDAKALKIDKSDSDMEDSRLLVNATAVQFGTIPPWNNKYFIHKGKIFTFILTNHVKKGYCISLSVPRAFKYPSLGVIIETEYCISLITNFPYISYFAHILEQFEGFGGLHMDEPLPRQEEGFPIIPQVRQLNDLALRLNRLLVPVYNGVVPENELPQTIQPKLNVNADVIQPYQKSSSSTDDVKSIYLNHHAPIEFHLIYGSSRLSTHQKLRIDLPLKRDLFQAYFHLNEMSPIKKSDLHYKNLYTPTEEQENEREMEHSYHLLLWSLPILLNFLSLEDILMTVGCLMNEMTVVVQSSDPTVISGCVVALMNLIRPLKWVCSVIVLLPEELFEYLESPIPLIAGVESLPETYQSGVKGIILVKPEERKVLLHVNDIVNSHTFQLPRAHRLIPILKPYVEAILKITRRAKDGLRYPTIINTNTSAVKSSFDTSSENIPTQENPLSGNIVPQVETYTTLPLPIDVDAESEKGKEILLAVQGFAEAMASHIQMIINTSLQRAWETKRMRHYENKLQAKRGSGKINPNATRVATNQGSHPMVSPIRYPNSSSMSLVSELTDFSNDNIALTETDSTETASSLPSVQKDAPVLPNDIGEAGLIFLSRLSVTQLYSAYCYSKSSKKREEQEVDDVWDAYKYREHHLATVAEELGNSEEKLEKVSINESMPNSLLLSGSTKSIHNQVNVPNEPEHDEDSSTLKEDPLILLFQIMLSGTVPISQRRFDELKKYYDETSESENIGLLEKDTYWCNGKCAGSANTPFCTNICMLIWEKRVEYMRKQMNLRDVIERQHHSDLVLNTTFKVDISDSSGYLKQSKEISMKPKPQVIRHKKETESQYKLRKSEILHENMDEFIPSNDQVFSTINPYQGSNNLSSIEAAEYPSQSFNLSPQVMTNVNLNDMIDSHENDLVASASSVEMKLSDSHSPSDDFGLKSVQQSPTRPIPAKSIEVISTDTTSNPYPDDTFKQSDMTNNRNKHESLSIQKDLFENKSIPDEISVISSDDYISTMNPDEITSVDLPPFPVTLRRTSSMKSVIAVPFPADINEFKLSNEESGKSNQTSSSKQDLLSSSSYMALNAANPTIKNSFTKQNSKYSLMFQSKNERKANRSSISSKSQSNKLSKKIKSSITSPAIYAPRVGLNGAPSRRLYARSNASPVIKALATYYASKQKQRLRQHTVFALKLIESIIYTFILRRRYLRIRQRIICIQKYIRRYLIRHLKAYSRENLYENLIRYRCGKILVRIWFKSWLRKHIKTILEIRKFKKEKLLEEEKKLTEQRKRIEQELSIHLPANLPTTDILSDYQSNQDINGPYPRQGPQRQLQYNTTHQSLAQTYPPAAPKPKGFLSLILNRSTTTSSAPINSNNSLNMTTTIHTKSIPQSHSNNPQSTTFLPLTIHNIANNHQTDRNSFGKESTIASGSIASNHDKVNQTNPPDGNISHGIAIQRRQDSSGSDRSVSPAEIINKSSQKSDQNVKIMSTSPEETLNIANYPSRSVSPIPPSTITISNTSATTSASMIAISPPQAMSASIIQAPSKVSSSSIKLGLRQMSAQELISNEGRLKGASGIESQYQRSLSDDPTHVVMNHEDIYSSYGDYDGINVADDERYIFIEDDNTSLVGPLKSLGPVAQDSITPQQKAILVDMWKLLINGIAVRKHCRQGKPRSRYLYCDLDMTKLFWRVNKVGSATTGRMSDPIGELPGYSRPPRVPYNFASLSRSGSLQPSLNDEESETTSVQGSVSGSLGSNWQTIRSSLNYKKKDSDRELYFRDITKVVDDISTPVMARAHKDNNLDTEHKYSIISIVVANRTLDLEIEKIYWERIYHALQVLVNYYRVILPSKNASNITSPYSDSVAIAGVSYHHRSSKRHSMDRRRANNHSRPFLSKTPLVISEAVQLKNVNNAKNTAMLNEEYNNDMAGDDWNNAANMSDDDGLNYEDDE